MCSHKTNKFCELCPSIVSTLPVINENLFDFQDRCLTKVCDFLLLKAYHKLSFEFAFSLFTTNLQFLKTFTAMTFLFQFFFLKPLNLDCNINVALSRRSFFSFLLHLLPTNQSHEEVPSIYVSRGSSTQLGFSVPSV